MNHKKKNKFLEITILLIIIATISSIIILSQSYLKKEANTSYAKPVEDYTINKIHMYQTHLYNISTYNIPFNNYIDTRSSTYTIYIKSTDNKITGITEIININYFNPNEYSYDEMMNINKEAIKTDEERLYEQLNPEIIEETIEENEDISEDINEIPIEDELENNEIEKNDEDNENSEISEEKQPIEETTEEENEESNIIISPPISELTNENPYNKYPLNWLDLNQPYEDFNISHLINYCNSFNEIESSYSLTCRQENYSIRIKNEYILNSNPGYIFETKHYTITLPVKRGTKFSDFEKELKNNNITYKQVDNI